MPIDPGTRIGPYEIAGVIGAGGMGEVYRARDTRLDRTVAIKVLPEIFSTDGDRLARFEREAKTLASLNHPNIAQIFGTESAGTVRALAMEYVDGDDLAQRLERGALPLDDATAIARQIADALEAAHDHGIIHRDLKPANVKVRPDGTVKVLDFGLAKATDPDVARRSSGGAGIPNLAHSPTFTSPAMTQMGMILGTAAYMSPEQARGKPVDRRADIWAFGCLLYEMLAGRPPFAGDDVSLTLAAVLKEDVNWSALPATTPSSIRRLLRRCLEKDPRKRLSSIADARLELDEPSLEPGAPHRTASSGGWRRTALWGAAGVIVGALIAAGVMVTRSSPDTTGSVVRSELFFSGAPIRLASGGSSRAFAIDPAGTEIVFVAVPEGEAQRLNRRRLADTEASAIAGTEHAFGPFFSRDGRWLAFAQQGRLKKMPAGGGAIADLGPASGTLGGTFLPDGSLIINPQHGDGLFRVPAEGGERAVVTTVARDKGEAGHHWPHVLPDGKHVLFTVEIDGKPYSQARIEVLSLDTRERRVVVDGGSDPRYLGTGHLIYWREGDLWGAPFDLSTLATTGPAAPVLRGVVFSEPNGMAHAAVADNGTLVYLSGRDPNEERELVRINRRGETRPLTTERRAFEIVSISPDGRRLAATIIAANDSIWTMDLGRGSLSRVTYEAENSRAVWSPDGTRFAFARYQGGEQRRVFVMPSDGSGAPTLLRDSERAEAPTSWTSNGNLLAVTREEHETGRDVWIVPVDDPGKARPFVNTRFQELLAAFSPDGRWIAYVSDESGRPEVYVRPYPGPGQKQLVSSGGGTEPRWRSDGRELFYWWGDSMFAADVMLAPTFSASNPKALFKGQNRPEMFWSAWDVLPDGQEFIVIRDLAVPRTSLRLVQNWFKELR